jgi:hypothetical protein
MEGYEIKDQFNKAEEYRESEENMKLATQDSRNIYVSQLLNSFTKDLSKHDDISVKINFLE